jgi:hypothetical protein
VRGIVTGIGAAARESVAARLAGGGVSVIAFASKPAPTGITGRGHKLRQNKPCLPELIRVGS